MKQAARTLVVRLALAISFVSCVPPDPSCSQAGAPLPRNAPF